MIKTKIKLFSKYQVGLVLGVEEDDLTPLYLDSKIIYGEDFVMLRDLQQDVDDEVFELYFPLYEDFEMPDLKVTDIVGHIFLTELGLEKITQRINNENAKYLKTKFKMSQTLLKDFQLYSRVSTGMLFSIIRDFSQNEIDKDNFYLSKITSTRGE